MPPIYHKFHEISFNHEFQTHNSILDTVPYRPEVMIIGTYNPGTPNANFADFFYGRNYLWTGFKNLFTHNQVELQGRRMPTNGAPQGMPNPSLNEILDLCRLLKLTFSDLIDNVLHSGNPQYRILANDNVIYNGFEHNLIQDGQKKNIMGLAQLQRNGQICWNDQNIMNYLVSVPEIQTIYLTRRPTGVWADKWTSIVNNPLLRGRQFINMFTPSGQGSPVLNNMSRLLNHWVHNENPNFGKLNNNWLLDHGVNLANF
jgi:hypothetical protein